MFGRMGSGRFISGKDGIARVVDLDHLGLPALEQPGEPAGAIAPHGIHHDRKACILDPLEIDQFMEVGNVGFSWHRT